MVLILLLFVLASLDAQFYEYGQDAGSLKWQQFKTPNYKVIYPEGLDSLAGAFANRLEYFYPHLGAPLDHAHSPMPVIIHNESAFSNGVFVWAPKRLEIFTNPDPNGYHQDWLSQLALHEGRHAFQIDKLNQGFTKGLSYLGGEQMVGAMAIFLPYWYLEGDAVDAETRLSNTGRGRQPSFEMGLKAQILETGKIYSFSKATMGSYRHYIPNHYELGYLMVRHGRRNYGEKFWIDFQQYAARKPFLLNPTYFSMKKYGFKSKKQFYFQALDAYRQHWMVTAAGRSQTPYTDWNTKRSRHYTSYTFPHAISGSMVFALKRGIDQIPEFIFLGKNGEEKRMYRPGFLNSGRVSFSGSHVVWDEFVPDLRWSNRNYSVIRRLEVATGKVKNLGQKTRYYSPALSKDGSRIAAIEQTADQNYKLILMGIDGQVLESIPSPGKHFLQHPAWMETDSALVIAVSEASGKSLYSYSTASGTWTRLFEAGFDDISYPVVANHRIYFGGTFSGIDNIYCLDLETKESYQLTSARFGAFYPQVSRDEKVLYYSNYSALGNGIVSMPVEEGLWKPLEQARSHTEQINYRQTAAEKEVIDGVYDADTTRYESRKYRKSLNLFTFHSWLPLYFDYLNPELDIDPEHLPVSPGISLISQNRLSTAVSQLGYEYRDGYHLFHSGIQLKGKYPILNLYFDYGGEPNVLLMAEGDSVLSLPNNLRFTAQTYVPLRFNTGKYISLVQPRIDYSYRRDVQYNENEANYQTGAHYLYYSLYASAYLRQGRKEILPRLGLVTTAGYYHAPFNHQLYGAVARGGVTAYLPGPLKHQTLKISLQYQKQYPLSMSRPAFINLMALPRGLFGIYGEELRLFTADYVFPIAYPDLELGALLYLKRIRGGLWGDFLNGSNVIVREPDPHYEDKTYSTVGADLIADLNVLRISFPLSVGGRFIYEPDTGWWKLEAIFSVDIN
jgi:hypothetical protein